MEEETPLILSSPAARRLKLLLGHGVELTPHMQEECASFLNYAAKPAPSAPLRAAILNRPLKELGSGSSSATLYPECAVTANTLLALKLSDGSLVEVCNPNRKTVAPHLTIIRALATEGEDSVAYLSPVLAYNMGLSLHLWPLLHDAASAVHGHTHSDHKKNSDIKTNSMPPSFETVTVRRYKEYPTSGLSKNVDLQSPLQQQQEQSETVRISQGISAPAEVIVASELTLASIRVPITGVLETALAGVDKRPDSPETPTTGGKGGIDSDGIGSLSPSTSFHHQKQQQNNKPMFEDDDDIEDAAVEALQAYFKDSVRLVCLGDIIAVTKRYTSPVVEFLGHMYASDETQNAADDAELSPGFKVSAPYPEVILFRVTHIAPQQNTACAILTTKTTVKLEGESSSGIPVGLRGYLAPVPPPSTLLGIHPAAAATTLNTEMEGIGSLLPAWRLLARLLASVMHPAALEIPLRVAILVHGPPGSGKHTAITATAAAVGCHVASVSCHDIRPVGLPDQKVLGGMKAAFEVAAEFAPTLLVLQDINALTGGQHSSDSFAARAGNALAECIHKTSTGVKSAHDEKSSLFSLLFPAPVILIATATSLEDVDAPVRRCFTHTIELEAPSQDERKQLLSGIMGKVVCNEDLLQDSQVWEDMARHTAGLLPRDLKALAADACSSTVASILPASQVIEATAGKLTREVSNTYTTEQPTLQRQHLDTALERARQRTAEDIGAPKIPNVGWDDVGGLEDVKRAILDTVELPLRHPELFAGGLRRRSGVLLYGPPGTGKTLLAKAVATECSVNFMSVKGPELISMYVGESERLIREVFARARRARPCVVFFDELDSLAPARGRGSDSGGVMDRVVSQLLAEIDGVHSGGGNDDVFMIGATNRPDLLDAALLRPGRLDRLLYVGVAAEAEDQLKVIRALTRKFVLHSDVDLETIAHKCPPRLTGADLYALCSDAWMNALKRIVAEQQQSLREGEEDNFYGSAVFNGHQMFKNDGEEEEEDVAVQQQDFETALEQLRPSLTPEDIAKYENIRDQYESQ